MPRTHGNHNVVLRDRNGRIITNEPYETFALAEPNYRANARGIPDGCVLTLQHGARIIRTTWGRNADRSILDGLPADYGKTEEPWNPVPKTKVSLNSQIAAVNAVVIGEAATLTGARKSMHMEHLRAALESMKWLQKHEATIKAAIERASQQQ